MNAARSSLALLMLLLAGCSNDEPSAKPSYSEASGDLSSFLLDQATRRGAHPATTNVPVLEADWRYATPNPAQVVIFVNGDRFSEIESLLKNVFGELDTSRGSSPVSSVDALGSRQGWYSVNQIGVSLQFVGWTNQTHVSIMGRKKS